MRTGTLKMAIILVMTCFAGSMLVPASVFAKTDGEAPPAGYETAAANEILTLCYSEENAAIAVRDSRNGRLWTSRFAEEEYPADNVTEAIKDDFGSLLLLSYSEMNLISAKDITRSIAALHPAISAETIPGGVQFVFFLADLSLRISVRFTIDGDSLLAEIPEGSIEEAVGTSEKIQENLADVYFFIDYLKSGLEELSSDANVVSADKKNIPALVKMLDSLQADSLAIPDAMGIEVVSNRIIKKLDEIQKLYAGSSGSIGIYNRIIMDEQMPDTLKKEYKKKLTYIEDYMTLARIASSSLKTITVGGVVSISLLPYFGAAGDTSEGYMLYPDGSGAITHFKQEHSKYSFGYVKDIYSDDKPNIDWEQAKYDAGIRNTNIPVFGIRKNGAAFVADIEEGDSNAGISYYPSGYIVDVNRAYFSFIYRRRMIRDREAGVLQQGSANEIYEETLRDMDSAVRFMFLADADADYSGMANRLRAQMLKDGRLVRSALADGRLPVGVELFGGIEQTRLIYKEFIAMTTYDQAGKIIADLAKFEDVNILVNYRGWSSSGIDRFPTSSAPADKLGGEAALKRFAAFVSARGTLFLQGNFVEAQAGRTGYNSGDLALSSSLRPIASNVSLNWIISPYIIGRKVAGYLGALERYGAAGITYDKIGTFIYYDYSTEKSKKIDRSGTVGVWQSILGDTRSRLGNSAVISANSYTFADSDWIIKAPRGSSEYVFTDESVPFYEMIIHGIIPYTIKPFNNFSDFGYERLVTIEYGGSPYYLLAEEDPARLGDLSVNMFTARYADYKEQIYEEIKRFIADFGAVGNKEIVRHYRPSKGHAVVVYSDGTKVCINYNGQPGLIEGAAVEGMNYKVIGKERSVKYAKEISYDETSGKPVGIPVYIAVACGILGILCVSAILFRRSRIQQDHQPADEHTDL